MARAVIGGTMSTAEALPFRVELSEAAYLVLLKQAKRQTRVSARLIGRGAGTEGGNHLFTGFLTDGLALLAVARVHAPDAVPAIERALKRAREG